MRCNVDQHSAGDDRRNFVSAGYRPSLITQILSVRKPVIDLVGVTCVVDRINVRTGMVRHDHSVVVEREFLVDFAD